MAETGQPPKLTVDSSFIDPNPRPLKRRRRGDIVPGPPVYEDAPAVLPAEMVAGLLNRSTAVIMKSVGFDGATAVAQERLRQLTEDYYLQMLHTVQLFAHAQRRTRPTVLDFQDMLTSSHIPLASLEDELKRVPSKSHSFVPPPPPPPPPPAPELSSLLGPELVDGERDKRKYVYDHLPPFPSKHTFMETPVFTERPVEPRMIRERATEEARLAENALRKLLAVSAASKDLENSQGGMVVGYKRKQRDEAWKKAFEGLNPDRNAAGKPNGVTPGILGTGKGKAVEGEGDAGYLEVIVNADSQFWRKGTSNAKKRRPTTTAPGGV